MRTSIRAARAGFVIVVGLIVTLALTNPAVGSIADGRPATSPTGRETTGETAREVKVYFSRHPESDADMTAVFPVTRTAPDAGVARAALQALVAGPTQAETDAGYFSELGSMLVGPSSCGADDATIRISDGAATVRFCRDVRSAGIGQDARAQSAINATLKQFSTIQRVRLLTREGDCLFDMSGENRCLAPGS